MVDISLWLESFLTALDAAFADRVFFVGLQGSYARSEAVPTSDIDVVVILDRLDAADVAQYSAMLDKLPHRNLMCGFLSGRRELLRWEPSDLFQFYHDTKPLEGSLDDLIPLLDRNAVDRAIKIGACGIYHGCVHNMVHDKSDEILRGLYKSAAFVLQAAAYRTTGRFISRQADLLPELFDLDRSILETALALKQGAAVDFTPMSEELFAWAQNRI
jgi:hypothetical protein